MNIVKAALTAPCKTIAKNAGVDSERVVNKLLQSSDPNEGYDALHDKYVDMIQAGPLYLLYLLVSYFLSFISFVFTSVLFLILRYH